MILSHHILPSILLICSALCIRPCESKANYTSAIEQEKDEITYKITILKSTGEPQTNMFIKLQSRGTKYDTDKNGVITFKFSNESYIRTANLFFNDQPNKSVKHLTLSKEKNTLTFYIDSQEDLANFKRTNQTISIEAMVQRINGDPIEGASVSVQGTGRKAFTDEIGLFKIEADFTHPIVIRADGMVNRSMTIQQLLDNQIEELPIVMYPKNNHSIYSSVEKMPEFPGGMQAYQDYLKKHLEYPSKAKEAKIEGVVVIQFTVESDGSISNPIVARHLENSLDSAAWRAIQAMPRWIPGSDYGLNIRCKYSLPVSFKIPVPKPVVPKDSLQHSKDIQKQAILTTDSLQIDSLQADSLTPSRDSLMTDSMLISPSNKALSIDSVQAMAAVKDSLQQDSTQVNKQEVTVKAKKRNIFVRFFRWLFGIKDKEQKETIKHKNQAALTITEDSIHVEVDSLDIHVDSLQAIKERLKTQVDSIKTKTDSIH